VDCFEELAALQGVAPISDFASLIGRPSTEDESAEEFSAMLRTWRRESVGAPGHNGRRARHITGCLVRWSKPATSSEWKSHTGKE
jgi:hypothetical protein